MMHLIHLWLAQFVAVWHSGYFIFLGLAFVFVLLLRKHSHGVARFAALTLVLFVLCLAIEASLLIANSHTAAQLCHYAALLILGILTTRLIGLVFFRLLIPHFNLRPPRILEELLILLGYVGWTLYLLSDAGIELSSLITSTAVITAILAFAMQDTLGNILSGLALQLDQSICIGDWLEFDDMFGQVVQVQWRHTAIMTRFGEKILIPNSELMKNRVKIIGGQTIPGRYNSVFFYTSFAISPTEVVQEVERTMAHTRFDKQLFTRPAICQVFDFKDGHITYALRFWVDDPRRIGAMRSLVWQHLYALFQRKGWFFSAPSQDVSLISHHKKTAEFQQYFFHQLEDRLHFLKQIVLFEPLTEQEFNLLAERLNSVFYVEGSTLIKQGEPGQSMFIVVDGQAGVYANTQHTLQQVATLTSGEIFGEMSLMTGDPRQARVIADAYLVCYELDKVSFSTILQSRPELAVSIANLLSKRKQELQALQKNVVVVHNKAERQHLLWNIRRWI